jgi:MFS family permease
MLPTPEEALDALWQSFIALLPNIVAAIIWVALGIIIGVIVGKIVSRVIDKYVEKPLAKTDLGKSIQALGIELSSLIGGLVMAFIIALSLVVAIGYIPLGGDGGAMIYSVVSYIPYLIGGIAVLTLGIILSILLSKYIGSTISPSLGEGYKHLVHFIENLVLIGLIAVMLTVAFTLLRLPSGMVYPLLVGVVSIAMGVIIVVETTKTITENNPDFAKVAPYLQFTVILAFILVGLAAIFSSYGYVGDVLKMLSLGIAIAFAIVLIPVAFYLVKSTLMELKR